MSAIAVISQDGIVTDVVMGGSADITVLNDRFPETVAVVVPEGARVSRGDKYDATKGFVPVASAGHVAASSQVDF